MPIRSTFIPGSHLTPAEVEELKDLICAFGLTPLTVPTYPTPWMGTSMTEVSPLSTGGVPVDDIRRAARSAATLYVGDSLARVAHRLEQTHGVPAYGFASLTGLAEVDRFVATLAAISGHPVPLTVRRARSRLLDAMVDSHYSFGGKKIALALEADHLKGMTRFFAGMGCIVQVAIAATRTRGLDGLPSSNVQVGDLEDMEVEGKGADLLVANSNGRQACKTLGIKSHLRTGYPVFDRLGAHS